MPITLTVVRGPHAGKVFALDRHDTFVVGRSREAHLCLPDDPYFSRHHALVEVNAPLCRVTDLNSRNGTLVNGVKTAAVDLRDGDEIAGGQTTFKVTITPDPQEGRTLDLPGSTGSFPSSLGIDDFLRGVGLGQVPKPGPERPPEIPGYRDLSELGRGGMGVVYRARREADGATVAVKTIRPTVAPRRGETERFLRETRILASLSHPRIVALHDAGEAGGALYFVMELVPGTDARRRATGRPLRPTEVADLVGQLCEALAYAHGRGFVHRDVKPDNLLLAPAGPPLAGDATVPAPDRWELKLADFGLAKAYHESGMSGLTVSGSGGGTPAFMAPEQITEFKTVRPAADQYAAAATAYFLLTGTAPVTGHTTAEVLKRVLAGDVVKLDACRPDVPSAVAAVVHRALALRPEDRFPDVGTFAAALRRAAERG